MSNNKWEKSNEVEREINRFFDIFSRQNNVLEAHNRLSPFAADFFGYRWIKFSKDFDYTYTEKENRTYAVETTYTTEAKVNALGNIDIETKTEDKTYDYPIDVEHESSSSTTVYKRIKFVSGCLDIVKQYEEEMAGDKNFTYFVYSMQKRKRPNLFLYFLNFIFDFSTSFLLLFALIQMVIYPFIYSVADYFMETSITLPFSVDNLRFNTLLPAVVLVIFLVFLGLNQLIKIKINDRYRRIVPAIIAAVLFVVLGYMIELVETNSTLNDLYENTAWFELIITIIYLALIIVIPILSIKYIKSSIFKTRYFVALYKYLKQEKGKKMAKMGEFAELKMLYSTIIFYSGVSFGKSDYSMFENNGISVSY